MFIYTEVPAVV